MLKRLTTLCLSGLFLLNASCDDTSGSGLRNCEDEFVKLGARLASLEQAMATLSLVTGSPIKVDGTHILYFDNYCAGSLSSTFCLEQKSSIRAESAEQMLDRLPEYILNEVCPQSTDVKLVSLQIRPGEKLTSGKSLDKYWSVWTCLSLPSLGKSEARAVIDE